MDSMKPPEIRDTLLPQIFTYERPEYWNKDIFDLKKHAQHLWKELGMQENIFIDRPRVEDDPLQSGPYTKQVPFDEIIVPAVAKKIHIQSTIWYEE